MDRYTSLQDDYWILEVIVDRIVPVTRVKLVPLHAAATKRPIVGVRKCIVEPWRAEAQLRKCPQTEIGLIY